MTTEIVKEKQVYTVTIPSKVNVNSMALRERKNGKYYLSWKEGKETITYQVSPIFAFESNNKNIQKWLGENLQLRTGTHRKKIIYPKKPSQVAKKPVATGEIPHGLSRNEFRKYSKSQQEWNEYITKEESRWNNKPTEVQQEIKGYVLPDVIEFIDNCDNPVELQSILRVTGEQLFKLSMD